MTINPSVSFGDLLKHLRKRAGMTQGELAATLGYSISFVSALEQNRRLPDIQAVIQHYLPALGLQDEPKSAAQLVELAALARGEKPPAAFTIQRQRQLVLSEEIEEENEFLPLPPTPLLGRETEVRELCSRLQGHSGRLLTLIGPPGVGKTRLALAVASELQSLYRDGARFIPLAAVSDANLLATTLVSAFDLHEGASKPPQTRLIEYLRHKEMLLVLDNFEQIIDAAPMVAELLAQCAGLRILVTSRERLHLRAEQRYKVQPLELAAAVELFAQRAQAVDSGFILSDANRPTIEAICKQLDSLPLALELCAAQSDLFSPVQLFAELQVRSLDLLVDGAYDLPEEQRTLRDTIRHSYAALSLHDQRLFRILGLFAGGFDLQGIAHFGFQSASLQILLHKSMIADSMGSPAVGQERRFVLLETIRLFALEQLAASGEAEAVHQTFFEYFLALAERAAKHQDMPDRKLWLDRLNLERANIVMALQVALAQNAVESTAKLVNKLYWFWYHLGLIDEGRQWFRRVLEQSTSEVSPKVYAETLLTAGHLAQIQGDWKSALEHFAASIKLFHAAHDKENLVKAQTSYSEALLDTDKVLSALASIQTCIDQVERWTSTKETDLTLAQAFYIYARILLRMEQIESARLQLEKSIDYYRRTLHQSGYAYALYSIAQIDMRQERHGEARAKFIESLAIFREYESHLPAACCYYFLGYLDRVEHSYEGALHNYINGLKLFIRMGNTGSIVGSITDIAKIAIMNQQYVEACHLFGKADFLRNSIGETQWKALPAEQEEYERHLELLNHKLSKAAFAAIWKEGQAMETEALADYVSNFIVASLNFNAYSD